MMTSVSGKRGIGKTYHLSKEIYQRYLEGYFIITNFSHIYSNIDASDLSPDDFYHLLREVLLFKDLGYEVSDLFPDFQHTGIFIGIDEGHLYFSADMYKRYQEEEGFQDIIRILAQARKLDIEIWYTTQDPSKIDKNWRRYTEDWVRYTPFLSMSYKKLLRHPSKPIFRRELRYPVPLVWEEWHDLDHVNPVFDYSTVTDTDGFKFLSTKSTLVKRRLKTSGWLDPFPYHLYDSNQVLAIKKAVQGMEFNHLKDFGVIPHVTRPERFPTFKKLLGMTPNYMKVSPRLIFRKLELPAPAEEVYRRNVLKQPKEFIDDLKLLNKKRRRAWGRAVRGDSSPLPSSNP
jgi:hypothetical protein